MLNSYELQPGDVIISASNKARLVVSCSTIYGIRHVELLALEKDMNYGRVEALDVTMWKFDVAKHSGLVYHWSVLT